MANNKKPARKGGAKKAAPKKAVKAAARKNVKRLAALDKDIRDYGKKVEAHAKRWADYEKSAGELAASAMAAVNLTERQADQIAADSMRDESYVAANKPQALNDSTATKPLHPTVEEQYDRDAALMQILHDPENQPSQYGTVPMSYLDKPKKPTLWSRFRSAITGLFVSKKYAEANPDTTVRERVK